ncbi:MAG: hypothetical protein NTY19_01080, partial [Planctomycetota bacterium]|nr:hypothetical protein [Planctomycetota bacterium]
RRLQAGGRRLAHPDLVLVRRLCRGGAMPWGCFFRQARCNCRRSGCTRSDGWSTTDHVRNLPHPVFAGWGLPHLAVSFTT